MRKLYTIFAIAVVLGFVGTASAHDSGHHCSIFGPTHSGCAPEPPPVEPPAPGGEGNTNTNTNTATGGAGGDGGNASVFGSGNSSSHSGSSSTSGVDFGSRNDFGGDGGDASLGAFNDFGGSSDQDQGQLQGQQQGQAQDNDVDVSISDNSVHSIDNDFPVNTAAPVFAGNCSQGISAQTMSFGGSIASGNPVCDYIAVAGAYIAGGDRTEAFRVLAKAENAADWRAVFAKIRMCLTLGLL